MAKSVPIDELRESKYPNIPRATLHSSSQTKDINSTLFVTYPWPLASLKIEALAAPFHWMRSKLKPSVTGNSPQKRKQKWRRPSKTNVVVFVTKICQEKSRRYLINLFIVHDQLCEISGWLLLRAF